MSKTQYGDPIAKYRMLAVIIYVKDPKIKMPRVSVGPISSVKFKRRYLNQNV